MPKFSQYEIPQDVHSLRRCRSTRDNGACADRRGAAFPGYEVAPRRKVPEAPFPMPFEDLPLPKPSALANQHGQP